MTIADRVLKTFSDVATTLDTLSKQYPMVECHVRFGPMSEYELAVTTLSAKIITLNRDIWFSPENLEKRLAKGFSAPITPSEIIKHEWAHLLFDCLPLPAQRNALREFDRLFLSLEQPPSKYAEITWERDYLRGLLETVAESFVLAERGDTSVFARTAKHIFEGLRNEGE